MVSRMGGARMRVAVAVLMAVSLLGGCAGRATRRAELETFRAVAPEYRHYVASDESLSAEQKLRRMRLVDAWGLRVREGAEEER